MKTLKELIADADAIKTQVADLQAELRDMEEANEQKQDIVDMARLMQSAAHAAISDHYLNTIKDAYTKEAYLTLLLSVANLNVSVRKKEDTPLLYPCRVAAALDQKPDMDLLLKKSMVLNEDSIDKMVNTLLQAKLQDFFILDCLMTTGMYDADNESKLEYIAGLGAMLAITKEALTELVSVAKAVLEKGEFIVDDGPVDTQLLLPYLKNSCRKVVINEDQRFIYYQETMTDVGKDFHLFENITGKKYVEVTNVRFKAIKQSLKFCDNAEICLKKCEFININLYDAVMNVKNSNQLTIDGCKFQDCYSRKVSWMISCFSAVIGEMECVNHVDIIHTKFVRCRGERGIPLFYSTGPGKIQRTHCIIEESDKWSWLE